MLVMVRLIIAGSRYFADYAFVARTVDAICAENAIAVDEIVSGAAPGVDRLAVRYAGERKLPCKLFPADWKRYGRSAGPRRNKEMAMYGDMLIAFTGGGKGTENMIEEMRRRGKKVIVVNIGGEI